MRSDFSLNNNTHDESGRGDGNGEGDEDRIGEGG